MELLASFDAIVDDVKRHEKKTVVIASAAEEDILVATTHAKQQNIAKFVYVGNFKEIQQLAWKNRLNLSGIEIIDVPNPDIACRIAIDMIKTGDAQILMKGKISTGHLLGIVLKDEDFKTRQQEQFLSHVSVFMWNKQWKIFSDPALTVCPNLEQKRKIALNAIKIARQLGINHPRVAFLSAVEKVSPKMPSSVEAAELADMEWDGAIVGGPLAFDGAMFENAYQIKGVSSPVGGKADILICPNIETANIFYKILAWMFQLDIAGVITGGALPIILTSRADSARVKFLSIAMTIYLTNKS
jgi:phosphate butyryltransferase